MLTAAPWVCHSGSGLNIGDLISGAGSRITVTASELQNADQLHGDLCIDWGNFWCNPNTVEETIESTSQPLGFVRVWDLGTNYEYPALNCMPGGLSAQGRVDAFPGDDCASADRDRDGDPDSVIPGCQTNLTGGPG